MEEKLTSTDQLTKRELEILARLSGGLSDQQIADALYLSPNTVRWYNRQIYSKLGVGSRTQAIAHAKMYGLLETASPSIAPSAPRHNLPAPATPLIGRTREITEAKELLRQCRLLTLTGIGGTGKTRLAIALATQCNEEFSDGICFVDLAPLSDVALVANAVAAALGVIENPDEPLLNTLKRVLGPRTLLLLIDNFEHVIAAAPLISELLAASPRLQVLATSREALRLSGEQEYPVPLLSVPTTPASPESLLESGAGALFVQRAQMVRPHFAASDENASVIAQICIRLEGLPLAIELAAARCKLLTPRALLERLEGAGEPSPIHTLAGGSRDAPPRHRTLRDTMAWSYNLLNEDEKLLFARLAVFRGGRSLEAIMAVCGGDLAGDVFDSLASLVDKSLVQQKELPGGEPRFTMLEMVHEYAREQLEASGEAATVQRRHADYFVSLAERAEPEMRRKAYDDWCRLFEIELDNIRTALGWALYADDVTPGLRLAGALCLYWYGKGRHVEGIRWTQRLLRRMDEAPLVYQPKFLVCAGHMAWLHDLDRAQALFKRALEISRRLGDRLQEAWALAFLGYVMMHEPDTALLFAEEGLALFRNLHYQPGIAQSLNIIGEIARLSRDDHRAKRAYKECLAVSHETGEIRRVCYMYHNLVFVAQHEGDHERALYLGREGLRLARDRKDRLDMAQTLMALAGPLGALGQLESAARLLGAAHAALERMGAFNQPSDMPEYDRVTTGLRAQLGEATFQAALAAGQEMTLEQAVHSALDTAS